MMVRSFPKASTCHQIFGNRHRSDNKHRGALLRLFATAIWHFESSKKNCRARVSGDGEYRIRAWRSLWAGTSKVEVCDPRRLAVPSGGLLTTTLVFPSNL